MGLFDALRSALGSSRETSRESEYPDIDGPFDENFPEPDNKSTLGDEEWRWDRAGILP